MRNSIAGQLWATYTRFGSFDDARQTFLSNAIWQCLGPHLAEVLTTVREEFVEPGTAPSFAALRPYLTDATPNIFSVLHLVTQSILDAYV